MTRRTNLVLSNLSHSFHSLLRNKTDFDSHSHERSKTIGDVIGALYKRGVSGNVSDNWSSRHTRKGAYGVRQFAVPFLKQKVI